MPTPAAEPSMYWKFFTRPPGERCEVKTAGSKALRTGPILSGSLIPRRCESIIAKLDCPFHKGHGLLQRYIGHAGDPRHHRGDIWARKDRGPRRGFCRFAELREVALAFLRFRINARCEHRVRLRHLLLGSVLDALEHPETKRETGHIASPDAKVAVDGPDNGYAAAQAAAAATMTTTTSAARQRAG